MDDEDDNNTETPSVREAMEAAFDEAEEEEVVDETPEDDEDTESEEEDGEEEDDEASDDEESGDDDGDEEEEDGDEESEGEDDSEEGDEDSTGDAEGDDAGDDEQSSSAPASWDPESREHWADVPDAVKETILAREKQISDTLGQTTQVRQFAAEWAEMIHPYQGLMAAQGATPKQAVGRLLEIGAQLANGNQVMKADVIKNLINQYQIDLPTLDSMLAGEAPAANQMVDVQSEVQKALEQERQRTQQERNQQQEQTVASEIETFSKDKKNEFFNDVRNEMADLLDIAGKNGRDLSIEDAYSQACQLNPKVKQVLDQRAAAIEAKKKKAATKKKKAAASSIKGKPGTGDSGDGADPTTRDAIANAWDQAEKKSNRI